MTILREIADRVEALDAGADREDFVAFAPKHVVILEQGEWDRFVAFVRAACDR